MCEGYHINGIFGLDTFDYQTLTCIHIHSPCARGAVGTETEAEPSRRVPRAFCVQLCAGSCVLPLPVFCVQLRSRILRSAVFCVPRRSAFSCVQDLAFSCVLRSAVFCVHLRSAILRSAAFCVQLRSRILRSAVFCVPRSFCVLLHSGCSPFGAAQQYLDVIVRDTDLYWAKNDLSISYSLIDPTLVGAEHPLKWPKIPKVPG